MGIGVASVIIVGLTMNSEGVPIADPVYDGYSVLVDGQEIGVVESKEQVYRIVEEIEGNLQEQYSQKIVVDDDTLSFIEGEFNEQENPPSKRQDLERSILASINYYGEVFAIEIEGEPVVHLRSLSEAEGLLEAIKSDYVKEDTDYELVEFDETVEVQQALAALSEIRSKDDARQILQQGTDEEETHVVSKGDTISVIADEYDVTLEEIREANPDIEDIHMISIGDELNLIVPKPYITVRTVEPMEYTEEIAFDTEYNDTDSLYEGDRKITQQGAAGERQITGYIYRENGRRIDTEIKEEKVLSQPVTRVVARGTAKRPTTVASGAFSSPTRGRLTSGFGPRWGTIHNGIDVAGPTGTPVNAADGGRVEFAGYRGSYGNLIIIDHENGYQTYYAHLNSIGVSRGDRVQKGGRIGAMGSTGRSTGPHLHFEVRRNGEPINPLNFVNY